jgi:hypothetical protein
MNEPVAATQAFSITLEAQQWNGVLAALGDAPWRVANPLIQAISTQLQNQAQGVPNGAMQMQPAPLPTH